MQQFTRSKNGPRFVGYTHQASWCDPRFASIVMASCETVAQAATFQAKGYRTFRVRKATDPILPGEISCPASEESGKRTQCDRCLLCDGKKGPDDKRKNITIIAHGLEGKRSFQ